MPSNQSPSAYALTSLIYGEKYTSSWASQMLPTWAFYCERHGFDLIVYLKALDDSPRASSRKFNWQKCLILNQPLIKGYRQVAWVDADIAINACHAPSVFDGCPEGKVGAVGMNALPTINTASRSSSQPTVSQLEQSFTLRSTRELILEMSSSTPSRATELEEVKSFYANNGFKFPVENTFNTGVLVLSPNHHAELLNFIYNNYEDIYRPLSDNVPLPAEVFRRGLLHDIDSRFNVLVNSEVVSRYPFLIFTGAEFDNLNFVCLQSSFVNSFFLHFAGAQQRQELFRPIVYSWKDFCRLGSGLFPSICLNGSSFDPSAIFHSYFGLISSVKQLTAFRPKITQPIFLFDPKTISILFSQQLALPENRHGFYSRENHGLLNRSYCWLDGRYATIEFGLSNHDGSHQFIKFQVEIEFLDDGRDLTAEKILSTSVFFNGYPHIERKVNSGVFGRPGPNVIQVTYTGYGWVSDDTNRIRILSPNWTAYSVGINNDPRTLSVALLKVGVSLFGFRSVDL